MNTLALDRFDRAILTRLQADGRETHESIGAHIGLSASAVLRRVKKLEEAGVIARYVALANAAAPIHSPQSIRLAVARSCGVSTPAAGARR